MNIKGFNKLKIWYKYYNFKGKVENIEALRKYGITNSGEQKVYYYLKKLRGYNVMKVDKKHMASINKWLKRWGFMQFVSMNGAPDLFAYKINIFGKKRDGKYMFVEVKQLGDGLRGNQLLWVQKNPKVNYCVLYVND